MKTFKDYIRVDVWFAWFPVRTDDGWVWLKYVGRKIDECPEVYLGLLPVTTYEKLKNK